MQIVKAVVCGLLSGLGVNAKAGVIPRSHFYLIFFREFVGDKGATIHLHILESARAFAREP